MLLDQLYLFVFFLLSVEIDSRTCSPLSTRLSSQWRMKQPLKPKEAVTKNKKKEPTGGSEGDILLRALRGEKVERTPVWLMRQAGRYMKQFREYSDRYSFRERSENPSIAVELSLQPWRKFETDGVIMFSDILTPLPAMGIDFSIMKGQGPRIHNPIRTIDDIERLRVLSDVEVQLPFVKTILQDISREVKGKSSVIGFVGAPWTLAAYAVEGGHSKNCKNMKRLCLEHPNEAHRLLSKITESVTNYALQQIEYGAQVVQIFESWAHHLSEAQFDSFAKPYAEFISSMIRKRFGRKVPVVYYANGGSSFLSSQKEMKMHALGVDWHISMKRAREILGESKVVCGNLDPMILYGSEDSIKKNVKNCIEDSGRHHHVLNLGHGVEQDTPEESVKAFVDAAKESFYY